MSDSVKLVDDSDKVFDVVGVGFGPANIAVAVALEELWPEADVVFLESRSGPTWQSGMMLRGTNIQHNPLRDLVTPRNPRSRYTFVNFLFENGRLFGHLNLPNEFALRREFTQYIEWVAGHFESVVSYATTVCNIGVADDVPLVVIRTNRGTIRGRAAIIAPGRSPYLPEAFNDASSERIWHSHDHLECFRHLSAREADLSRITVVGGSQSAIEIVLDLARTLPDAHVLNLVSGFGYRLKDTSPFSEEAYFPEFVDLFFNAGPDDRADLTRQLRPSNYSSADRDVIDELYATLYEQRLEGRDSVQLRRNAVIERVRVDERAGEVVLLVRDRYGDACEEIRTEAVVLATGYRDLGSGERQELCPPILTGLQSDLATDESGCLAVGRNYELNAANEAREFPALFLNGLCESTHGFGDAGSISLLSLRAERIVTSARHELHRDHAAAR